MIHQYETVVRVKSFHSFDRTDPPTYETLRREILKSLQCGYFGSLLDFEIVVERHETPEEQKSRRDQDMQDGLRNMRRSK